MAEETTTTVPGEPPAQPATEPVKAPEAAPEQPAGEKPVEAPKPPQPQTVPLHRLNEEVRKRRDLERELEFVRRNGPNAQPPNPNQPKEPSPPKWVDYEKEGKTAEEFNAAWVKFQVDEGIRQKDSERQTEAYNRAMAERNYKATLNFNQKALETASRNPDFHEVIEASDNAGIQFDPQIITLIKESDKAGDLAYAIAKDRELGIRLMQMPLDRAILELGRIESKLQTGTSGPGPKTTNTPPPPTPLSGNKPAPRKFSPEMTQAEFNAAYPPIW